MAFFGEIKDIKVMFGLDPSAVMLVPEAKPRNRHGHPEKNKAFLFDLDIRVTPEHDGFCTIGGVRW